MLTEEIINQENVPVYAGSTGLGSSDINKFLWNALSNMCYHWCKPINVSVYGKLLYKAEIKATCATHNRYGILKHGNSCGKER